MANRTVTLSMRELLRAEKGLMEIGKLGVKRSISLLLSLMQRTLRKYSETFDEEQLKLFKKYGTRSKDAKSDGWEVRAPGPHADEKAVRAFWDFRDEHNELQDQKVTITIPEIKYEEITNRRGDELDIPPNATTVVWPLLKNSDAEKEQVQKDDGAVPLDVKG